MRKLNVLQFGSSNGLFGAERWILALARYCDRNEVEHSIITIKDSPAARIDLVDKAEEMGFHTDLVEARGPYDPGTIIRTAALIRQHNIDILHTHGYKSDIIGYLAAKLARVPVISTPHGSELSGNRKLNMYHKIGDYFIRKMDKVVPVSEGLRDEYLNKGVQPEKIKLIMNGVDIMDVEEKRLDEQFSALKNEKNLKLVGYVGQLIERKGLPNLIKAMKTITKSIKVKLVLIGEGSAENALKKMVELEGLSGVVDFLGFRSDRLEIMKCFDVFVLPSYIEGLPRVIMEAMAAKVPVIASDIPGVREIIHHNKTGILVKTDSPDQLAYRIAELINNPQIADEIRRNAYENVRTYHSAERMSQEYTELYRNILNVKQA